MGTQLPTTSVEFYKTILGNSIASLKVNTFLDNYSGELIGKDGENKALNLNTHERVYFFDWFFRNHHLLFEAYSSLADHGSKELYIALLCFRLAGHLSVRIPVRFNNEQLRAEYEACEKKYNSALKLDGFMGEISHFNFKWRGAEYKVDCLGLDYYLYRRQYFFERDGVHISPELGDYVIDGGACLGDTTAVFSNAVGETGYVYAFDPVEDHIKVLKYNQNQLPINNVKIFPFGLSNENVDGEPISLNTYSPGFSAKNSPVPLRTIDELEKSHEIEKLDFLKLDVEGFELNVLEGAHNTIMKHQPKIALSLYHKPDDVFALILHIKHRYPFYSLYIDHYTIHAEETVLYCLPPEKCK